ncbi:MAG: hypothetical protein J6U17_05290 [Kiritimatiellae bacterium]|nr:hypothetical protein [Kiritimatiellia bacterium]
MKMLVAILMLGAAAVVQAEGAENAATNGMDKAERLRKATGGFVLDRREAKGRVGFVNMQSRVSRDVLSAGAQALESEFMLHVDVLDREASGTADIAELGKVASESGLDFAVVVADADIPMSMMLAPEQKYGIVNVRMLAKDNPPQDTLERRLRKEMARSMSLLFGSGYTVLHRSTLSPASTLAELDELPSGRLPAETSSVVQRMATENFGFKLFRRAFYIKALQEGWAPEPKGEYQKALWLQYHEMPTEPMKIEFDPKKGR